MKQKYNSTQCCWIPSIKSYYPLLISSLWSTAQTIETNMTNTTIPTIKNQPSFTWVPLALFGGTLAIVALCTSRSAIQCLCDHHFRNYQIELESDNEHNASIQLDPLSADEN
jgi:hypothetical protein